ncbi:MAG: signal recognition particle-docking protein FtsY [Beijerinckiaceae bacterium]
MADEKKPGFFKRMFGFGKAEPVAPVVETIVPEVVVVEAPPLRDEHAERIAAEIAEARRQAQLEAEQLQKEQDAADAAAAEAALKQAQQEQAEQARVDAARRQQEALAQEKLAREKLNQEKLAAQQAAEREADRQKLADEERDKEVAAQEAAARQKAAQEEAARLAAAEAELVAQKAAEQKAAAERAAQEQQAALARAEAAKKAAEAALVAAPAPAPKTSWWQKLKSGLSRTASGVSEGITGLFTKRKLDAGTLEDLEDILIQADLGIDVSARIAAAVGKGRYDKEIAPDEVKAILADEVAKVLAPVAQPLVIDAAQKPFVLLMVGVNGSGKTTTIGKLASKFRAEGKSVMLAAGDTFRAAAIEQLKVWGERTGAPVVAREQGGDAAGLAFDALQQAKEKNVDVLLIDTAGRLQNRTELMAELEKVVRVIKKVDASAPHGVLLVLDATVGQNALSQVEIFGKTAGVTGLVMTKLDGTARGGILVAISEKFKMPVHFIGVGEGVDDLEPFAAVDFARAIAGLEQAA